MGDSSQKQTLITNKYFRVTLLLILLILLFFYFKTFFTSGIYFGEVFLKKEIVVSDIHYRGSDVYGDYHIMVTGINNKDKSTDVIYRLPSNINRKFKVTFKDVDSEYRDWKNVTIADEKGNLLFEGQYQEETLFLIDKNGKPMMDFAVRAVVNGESPYDEEFEVPLKEVADIASFASETIRGEYPYLFIALILFAVLLIDIKFPLLFFNLEHFLDVRDPEPSDYYLFMQKASHYVLPIVGAGFLVAAIV